MPRQFKSCFKRAIAPVIEALEGRQMMSVTLDHGRVTVDGTIHADNNRARGATVWFDLPGVAT